MNQKTFRWYFNSRNWVPNQEEFIFALKCVQKEEQDRIMKFFYRKDLKHALIGRLLLRKCIKCALNIPNYQIKLKRSEKGKPILNEPLKEPFDFNVSHHGDYCVLAADNYSKVGTDVVKCKISDLKSISEYFKTMTKIFCSSEWDFIKGINDNQYLTNQQQLARFFRLWCLKESFVKAEGVGIGFELDRIKFKCLSMIMNASEIITNTNVYVDGKLLDNWRFEESLLDEKHCAAVALYQKFELKTEQSSNHLLPFQLLTYQQLINGIEPQTEVDNSLWNLYLSKAEH